MVSENHPLGNLMKTTMENLKEMVDVNKIVGDAVETPDGNIIIPVSRITFGFAAGGTQFDSGTGDEKSRSLNQNHDSGLPFGGGSGGGITIQPVAFLIVGGGQVRLLPVDRHAMLDRLIDLAPQLLTQLQSMLNFKGKNDGERTGI